MWSWLGRMRILHSNRGTRRDALMPNADVIAKIKSVGDVMDYCWLFSPALCELQRPALKHANEKSSLWRETQANIFIEKDTSSNLF